MELALTVKAKLIVSSLDSEKLAETCEQYRLACNFVSQYVFENDFLLNINKLNKALYQEVRALFGLKSQLAQSTFRTVTARYKTTETQLRQHPAKYDTGKKNEQGKSIYMRVPKDLSWLWKPIQFKRPQADLVRNRDFSFIEDGKFLSINTLKGRIKAHFTMKGFKEYLDGSWEFGGAKLVQSGKNWFLHISAKKEISELEQTETKHVVGIDRGIRQLMTTYDEKGNTDFFNGKAITKKRKHYKDLRKSLQERNTRNSKRRIRKIGQRENRWMNDVNHQLSETLVNQYGENTLFVIEDLTNVRFATEQTQQDKRYENVSWAFYQLEQFLTYKANKTGSSVVKFSAEYTSQRCPKCGSVKKSNRKHEIREYHCENCGYRSNDDRIAAMNIQQLGTMYVSGEEKPKFVKQTLSA